jgi:hypothetical protein
MTSVREFFRFPVLYRHLARFSAPLPRFLARARSIERSRMTRIIDDPFLVFFVFLVTQWVAAYVGDVFRRTVRPVKKVEQEDFNTVLTATLTLLALIIGFSFSMAVSDYHQRRDYEAAEASALGTEYLRADMLPTDDGRKVRELLSRYTSQRILFYRRARDEISQSDSGNEKLKAELWTSVVHAATAQPTAVMALILSGMNDVLNSQGNTLAAWRNRIPTVAWILLGLMAIVSNVLLGYRERSTGLLLLLVLPIVASIAFFLIADIDSPYGGIIRVEPQNLIAVSQSMTAH